jgi:arylsulfatase A-like enzyme
MGDVEALPEHIDFFPARGLWLAFLSTLMLSAFAAVRAAEQRPNILYIMSDDHAYQAISAYGSKLTSTPNIDRIAKGGLRFNRCYVTNSLCGPSRACVLTGTYSHINGMYDHYSSTFNDSLPTFPKLLQAAGYQTAIVGKWHLTSDPAGFDYWDVLPGQGKYYQPDFLTSRGKSTTPGYVTDIITKKSLDWLETQRDRSKPFLLMVHHKAPHRPWDPASEKLAEYEKAIYPEPATLFDDYATRGRAAKEATMRIDDMNPSTDLKFWGDSGSDRAWLYGQMAPRERAEWESRVDPRRAEFEEANPQGRARTRWYYQQFLRDYLACVASVDDSVGQLLEYLDKNGLAANTIVVYVSDQGFYLGEHGWFDKRFMYEQSLRTPLMIRWPGVVKPGTVDDHMVSNVDFAETFLDAAGVDVPSEMQGRSILPILRGEAPSDWRTSFYYHYYEGAERDHHVPRHEGVTTGDAKLIYFYPLGEWQLFDLRKDPQELHNVWGKPEYAAIQKKLLADLERQRTELKVPPVP